MHITHVTESFSQIAALLEQGDFAGALNFAQAAADASRNEQAEYEDYLEAEAAASEAWRTRGSEVWPEEFEEVEVPF
jgi:DNA polymerase III delta prime subunit